MDVVLTELGKTLTARWAALIVLPGVLFTAALGVAGALGQAHPWDRAQLVRQVEHAGDQLHGRSAAGLLVLGAAIMVSAGAGLAAQALGGLISRAWLYPWPSPLLRLAAPLVTYRARRWDEAHRAVVARYPRSGESLPRDETREVNRRITYRNARGLLRPTTATWMADRMEAANERVWTWWGIDVGFSWPRLWLLLPTEQQEVLAAERARVQRAAGLAGWAGLYGALALWWWPAALAAGVALVSGWWQARQATDVFGHLVESAFDLHGRALAEALGLAPAPGPLSEDTGHRITDMLRKHA
ncbi:hypothetical protein ABZ584_00665 [Streptomyces antibioticus]|uniref:hypothetical protein n=1 Tax=Streptomyces antibioticus TaxID=1890 RepID=UPI0033E12F97